MNIYQYVQRAIALVAVISLTGCNLSGIASGVDSVVLIEEQSTGEILTLNEDGAFQFSYDYKSGHRYKVVVNSSGQSCVVNNGEGIFANSNISDVEVVCDDGPVFCTKQYDPVCAVVTQQIQCVRAPCNPIVTYQTFGNACTANVAKAEILFSGECGELEEQKARGIEIVDFSVIRFDRGDRVSVNSVSLEGAAGSHRPNDDVFLKFNLSYSGGCNAHGFTLFGDTTFGQAIFDDTVFSGNLPVYNRVYLFHQGYNDACDSIITEDVLLYLNPLKAHYKQTYGTQYGEIIMNITMPGANPIDSLAPEKLFQVTYRFDDRPKGKVGDTCGGFTLWPGNPACGAGLVCVGEGLPLDIPGTCEVAL